MPMTQPCECFCNAVCAVSSAQQGTVVGKGSVEVMEGVVQEVDEGVERGAGVVPCRAYQGLEVGEKLRAADDRCSGSDSLPHMPQGSWPPHAGETHNNVTTATWNSAST